MHRKSAVGLLPFAVVLAIAFLGLSCDTSTELNDITGPECVENHPAVLKDIFFYFKPPDSENFLPIAKPAKIKVGEDMKILITFEDEDCNVADGDLYFKFDGENYRGALPSQEADLRSLGCDDRSGSGPISLTLTSDTLPDSTGSHEISVVVRDRCDVYSNEVTGEFRLF